MNSKILSLILAIVIIFGVTGCCINSETMTEATGTGDVVENTASTEPSMPSEPSVPVEENSDVNTEPTNTIEETVVPDVNNTIPTEPPVVSNYELVNIVDYIPSIVVDLKYATTDNFTGKQIYESDMPAMLRYGTIKKLAKAQEMLNDLGYTLVIWDAYRPTKAQFKLWEVCPNSKYVSNPNTGFSSHSRGNTVDITIQTLNGDHVEMPTGFDDFSKFANRDYSDVSKEAGKNSTMLENIMKDCGFKPYSAEWWHFSDTTSYDVIK